MSSPTPRSIATSLSPFLTREAEKNKSLIVEKVSHGILSRAMFLKAWPTFLLEIPNGVEAVIRLLVKEFSGVPATGLLGRLEEIEENPAQFARESTYMMVRILSDMKHQFVQDAGAGWRRLTMRMLWNPVVNSIPHWVEVLIPHVSGELKKLTVEDLDSFVSAHK